MNKEDEELTRKAIEEILQDVHEHSKHEEMPQERKINPLGRMNKNFLGRTLNAMVRHNKRTDEQTRKKCRRRLKELDRNRYENYSRNKSSSVDSRRKHHKHKRKNYLELESSASEASSQKKKRRKSKSKHKNKKKKHLKERSRSSPSSEEETRTLYSNSNDCEDVDYNAAYMMVTPTLWDVQMQQFYQYKALMALEAVAQASINESVKIVELTSSSPSFSDIKLEESLSSSSDGEMLTINVSTDSDNEAVENEISTEKVPSKSDRKDASIEVVDSDSVSVKSVVSIKSTDNEIDLTED